MASCSVDMRRPTDEREGGREGEKNKKVRQNNWNLLIRLEMLKKCTRS